MMRGVAAVLVVLIHGFDTVLGNQGSLGELHVARAAPNLASFGAIGVDLFFVISGFVMALSVRKLNGRRDAGRFLALRWARIAPPYLVITAILVLLLKAFGHSFHPGWKSFFNAVLFVPLADTKGYSLPPLTVGWTLSFEFTFYLAVALMVVAGLARRMTVLAAILGGLGVVGAVVHPHPYMLAWVTNPILIEFAFGILAYWAWERGALRRGRTLQLIVGAAAVALLVVELVVGVGHVPDALATLNGSASAQRVLLWGIPAAAIFIAALPLDGSSRAPGRFGRGARVLGDASYSIYLVHIVTFIILANVMRRLSGDHLADVALVISVVIAVLTGLAYYRLVERPLSERVRRLVARPLHAAPHLEPR